MFIREIHFSLGCKRDGVVGVRGHHQSAVMMTINSNLIFRSAHTSCNLLAQSERFL